MPGLAEVRRFVEDEGREWRELDYFIEVGGVGGGGGGGDISEVIIVWSAGGETSNLLLLLLETI